MTAEARAALEGEVRRLCEEGAFSDATVLTVRGYGPEILGLLFAQQSSGADADEIFSSWSEQVFRGLPRFQWSASLRTWVYAVARNASLNSSCSATDLGPATASAR